MAGAITLIYEYNKHDTQMRLAEIKRSAVAEILSVQSFYISDDKIFEIIAVKGTSHKLTELSDAFIGIKGIEHGKLIMSKVD
ncbi:MAG: hypothetical protein ACOYM7_05775 [Paludibacter sp.]